MAILSADKRWVCFLTAHRAVLSVHLVSGSCLAQSTPRPRPSLAAIQADDKGSDYFHHNTHIHEDCARRT